MEFGYACISLSVEDCSTAKTVTVKSLSQIGDHEGRAWKLKKTARQNLINTLRLLWFNQAHDIKLYRFSSQIIPLATHPIAADWDWLHDEELVCEMKKIGRVVKENGFRVSSHPGEYTVLNTPDEVKLSAAMRDLEYHADLMAAMELDATAKMVIHVGGAYGKKEKAIERFIENFRSLREDIKARIVVENDDTTYSAGEVLSICREIGAPMVLDIHHHYCYNNGENLSGLIPSIFETWKDRPPKVHLSSPRCDKQFRSHADYIAVDDFRRLLSLTERRDFDVMIEAKMKDKALLKLREEINKTV